MASSEPPAGAGHDLARGDGGTVVARRAADPREEVRKAALTTFLDARVAEGYAIETHTDTHAIIAPVSHGWSLLDRLRGKPTRVRQVVSVDQHGEVTMAPAEPLRS